MTPTTLSVEPLDQPDPWGFGPDDDTNVAPAVDEPLDEPVDAADAAEFMASLAALPGASAFLASAPIDAPRPAPLPVVPPPRQADALLRLPFPRQMAGLIAVFALVIMAQAFYIGFSLTGEASARPDLGEVVVSSQPAGADVRVDGTRHGVTPLTVPLAAGRHQLEVSSDSTTPARLIADVVAGHRVSHHVVLAAAPAAVSTGALRVDTESAGATVFVDGVNLGSAPMASGPIAAGPHTVRVEFRPGVAVEREVTVPAGETLSLVLDSPAARAVPAGPVSGWVHVDAPFDVEVRRDGELIGTSASSRILLPAGGQVLELVNAALGYRASVRAAVVAGRVTTVHVDTPRVAVAINAQPWAEVVIDGRVHGETPLANLMLPIGTHQVVLRHPDLGERTETVTVRATGTTRLSVDLRAVTR